LSANEKGSLILEDPDGQVRLPAGKLGAHGCGSV
jgi:hypothetical protein